MTESPHYNSAHNPRRTAIYLFAGALLVRFWFLLQHEGLWLDEALTGWRTQSLSAIFEYEETVPPLYYLLVWMSRFIFGDGPLGLRMPGLLFGAALAPALYLYLHQRLGHRTAIGVALLSVFNGYLLRHSVEARCYALATWLGFVHAALAWELCRSKGTPPKNSLILFALTGIALAYTHNWGLVLMAAIFSTLAVRLVWNRELRGVLTAPLARAYLGIALVYLLYVPTLLTATSEKVNIGKFWPQYPIDFMFGGILGSVLTGNILSFSAFLVGGAILGLAFGLPRDDDRTYWGWASIFSLFFAALLQLKVPVWLTGRYDVVLLGVFLATLGTACFCIPDTGRRRAAWGMVALVVLAGFVSFVRSPQPSTSLEVCNLLAQDRPDLTLVAASKRFDPVLSVPIAYEFGVLRKQSLQILETPLFTPLEYGYVNIPARYQSGEANQAIPAEKIQSEVRKVSEGCRRMALVGPPNEVALLVAGLPGQWRMLSNHRFYSSYEMSIDYVLLQKSE